MRRAAVAMLALGLGWTAGCGALNPFSDDGPPPIGSAVPLTPPWTAWSLPVASGTVTMSEPESLTVRHPGSDVEAVLGGYRTALETAGWTLEADTSVPGVVNQSWAKDGTSLAVSGLSRNDEVKVSLSILPF